MKYVPKLSTAFFIFFFFNDTATTEIYTLSLHDALPIFTSLDETLDSIHDAAQVVSQEIDPQARDQRADFLAHDLRSEEHTSELQSLRHLVFRLLLVKNNSRR